VAKKTVAKKAKKEETAIAVVEPQTQELAVWEKELADAALVESSREITGGASYISLKDRKFKYMDEVLSDPLQVVVLQTSFDNAYYPEKFDPKNPKPPVCFAVGLDNDKLAPHPSSPEKQHDGLCADCPQNKWGSSGKGKACKNNRRLSVLPYDPKFDPANTEPAILKLGPTSTAPWARYVKKLLAMVNRPFFGVVTALTFDDTVDYEKVLPEYVSNIPSKFGAAIVKLRKSVEPDLLAPYQTKAEEKPVTKSKKQGKL